MAACNGGAVVAPPGNTGVVVDTISAVVAQTGHVTFSQGTPAVASPASDLIVGDEDGLNNGTAVRAFMGFDLSTLPAGIHLQSATLLATQCQVNGAPFANLGNVEVDHVRYPSPLDTTGFGTPAIDSGVGVLSSDTSLGPRSLVVTASITKDLAASHSPSQFRLRMAIADFNGDGLTDNVVFADDSAHTTACTPVPGKQPRLVIAYKR